MTDDDSAASSRKKIPTSTDARPSPSQAASSPGSLNDPLSSPATHKVVFQPSGRSGMVAAGTTVLEAARQLGVSIEAICSGRETCHKCLVRPEDGHFPRHNLTSGPAHLTPLTEREKAYRDRRGEPDELRFACSARITGDVLITVPAASQAQKQVVLKAASGRAIDVDPTIRLYYVEPEAPRLGAPADKERVQAELASRFNLSGVDFDYPALVQLSDAWQRAGQGLTLTVWNDRRVIRVQAGYHERPVGLAVDIGSTTLAAYLCDLRTGELLATASAMNPQVAYGDDIMSRVSYANERPEGRERLHQAIIAALNDLARAAARQAGLTAADIVDVTIVGNTVMHHLALGLNPKPLGEMPFIPIVHGPVDMAAACLGLQVNPGGRLHVLPVEAGFVGADNVGVILAEQPHLSDETVLIIDVGTNGELLVGNRQRLLCTSSPTGPALEGAQITHGMRAAEGAIERVRIDPATREVRFKVIGQDLWSHELPPERVQARGICGSGILEAVAEMFMAGILEPSGRFDRTVQTPRHSRVHNVAAFELAPAEQTATGGPIAITQADVRAIQLAKAALYVGAQFLMRELGVAAVERIVLAGAFGSVIDPKHALVLGMIPDIDLSRVNAAGNAAGDGARIALLNRAKRAEAARVARWVEHMDLPLEEEFQAMFMAALAFPHSVDPFPHVDALRRR